MKKIFTSLFLLTFLTTTKAQYVEVDNYFVRESIKSEAPGCFDGQDRLDTTCSGLSQITYLYLSDDDFTKGPIDEFYNEEYEQNVAPDYTLSVNGLQYLKNLQQLNIYFGRVGVSAQKQHLPNSLRRVFAGSSTGDQNEEEDRGFSIVLPDSVTYVSLSGWFEFSGGILNCVLPKNMEELRVIGSVNATGLANTKLKKITSVGYNTFSNDPAFLQVPNTVEEIIFQDISENYLEPWRLPASLPNIKKLSFLNSYFSNASTSFSISGLNSLEELVYENTLNFRDLEYPNNLKLIRISGCGDCDNSRVNTYFPETLETLHISNFTDSKSIEIEELPNSIRSLTLSNIKLNSAPILPNQLEHLDLSGNQIYILRNLPNTLKSLNISSNQFDILESIPTQLESLNVSNNRNLQCLPTLPTSLKTIELVNTAVTCIPNETNTIKATAALPLCPAPCGETPDFLMGLVFLDLNKNGVLDPTDKRIQGAFVHAGEKILTTNSVGEYSLYANSDTETKLTLTYKHPHLDKILPAQRTYTNSGNSISVDTMNFAVQLRDVKDVEVLITPFAARNGFTPTATVSVTNRGTLPVNNFNLSLHTPLHWSIKATTPLAQSTVDSIRWNNISLEPNISRTFQVSLTIPATDSIGTPFALIAKTHQILNDEVPQNNTFTFSSKIKGSFDPNDKLVYPESLTPGYAEGTELIYTVRFQNTGNDTAFTVVVKDTIQANLDPLSFRFISGSHPSVWSLNEQGVITFTFDNILLPDSNVNEPASNGQVTFAIQPKTGLASGASVENKAAIYFDFNAPIITNTAVARVEVITSVIQRNSINMTVYPNPAKDIIHLQWADGGKTYLSVSDISGKIVNRSVINGNYTQIPVQNLSKGMYIIQIQNELGTGIAKIIVQ